MHIRQLKFYLVLTVSCLFSLFLTSHKFTIIADSITPTASTQGDLEHLNSNTTPRGFQKSTSKNITVFYDNNGQQVFGWQTIDGKLYYFNNSDGAMTVGEKNIDNNWYLFDQQGVMQTGFQDLSPYGQNKTVFYGNDGKMLYGQQKINDNWYLFDSFDGAMKTGFQDLSPYGQNKTVFYGNDGKMLYGQQKINNSWYLFDSFDGAMKTGFQNLSPYGQNKTVFYGNDGKMLYGWQNIRSSRYYFDKITGQMAIGSMNINGKNYFFDKQGRLNDDSWGWPFPAVGRGYFSGAQLFGVNRGGEFRRNGFHNGLDFGSIDHPGRAVHAVHAGKVTAIGYMAGLGHYVVVQSDEFSFIYQEAFSSRSKISVSLNQQLRTGDVIGIRDTDHLHLGITREKNIMKAIGNSFNNNGTWLNPLDFIK